MNIKVEYILRPWNIWRRLILRRLWQGKQVTVRLAFGGRLSVNEGEFLGNQVINTRVFDVALSEAIWRIARKGDFVVDVGSNVGYTTVLMSGRIGETGCCIAFEPDPANYERLKMNISLNQLEKVVETYPIALSNKLGVATFLRPCDGNFGLGRLVGDEALKASPSLEVETVTLDSVLSKRGDIRLLKIDVEGHEAEVLSGAGALLAAKQIEYILFEEHGGWSAPSVVLLEAAGYAVRRLDHGLLNLRLLSRAEDGRAHVSLQPNFLACRTLPGLDFVARESGWHVL